MRHHVCLGAILALLWAVPCAQAQDKGNDLDEGVVVEEPFVPGVEPNTWELSFSVGFLDLKKTLLAVDGVVVDVENPTDVIFADMHIDGESAFSPQLMVNRTFGKHLAFENTARFSISNFLQSVSDQQVKWTNAESVNTLTPQEIEKGSLFVFTHEHALTYYPFGNGRVLPFFSAGIGTQTIAMDSDYVGSPTTSLQYGAGLGLRVVGDDLYSFRAEVHWYRTKYAFHVNDHFRQVINLSGDGLVRFPVSRLVDTDQMSPEERAAMIAQLDLDPNQTPDQLPRQVDKFDPITFTNLFFSLGFVAAF